MKRGLPCRTAFSTCGLSFSICYMGTTPGVGVGVKGFLCLFKAEASALGM